MLDSIFTILITNPLPVALVVLGVICIVVAIIGGIPPIPVNGARAAFLAAFGVLLMLFAVCSATLLAYLPELAQRTPVPQATPVNTPAPIVLPSQESTPGAPPTPTAEPTVLTEPSRGVAILVALPDGNLDTIYVSPVLGNIDRLVEINSKEGVPIPIVAPVEWEWRLPDPLPDQWEAYQLPDASSEPCIDWPNRYATASMRVEVAGEMLIFAEKGTDYPARQLIPISGTAEFPVLDNLLREDQPAGSGPLNGSIQVLLVSPESQGKVEFYDSNEFRGKQCVLTIGK